MAQTTGTSVLLKKTQAGRSTAPEARAVPLPKVLSGALSRLGEDQIGLVLTTKSADDPRLSLSEVLDKLPEGALICLLEGPRSRQGLVVLDQGLLSALIERQVTGGLSGTAPAFRRPTRTDATLCADVVDALMRAFEDATGDRPERTALEGFSYSTFLVDPRPLGLVLEDTDYRSYDLQIDIELGAREGRLLVALPRAEDEEDAPALESAKILPVETEEWQDRLEAGVMDGRATLTAELHRVSMSIAEVSALEVGDLVPVPVSAIAEVRLKAVDGMTATTGRLGQTQGQRAIRIGGPVVEGTLEGTAIEEQAFGGGAPALPDLGDLPDLPDLQGAGDTAEPMAGLPDLSDLPDLPDVDESAESVIGGLPDLPDLSELPEVSDLPDLADLPDLSDLPDLGDLPDLSDLSAET